MKAPEMGAFSCLLATASLDYRYENDSTIN